MHTCMHACMHACIQFSLTKRQSADRTPALPLAALAECAAASAVAPKMRPASAHCRRRAMQSRLLGRGRCSCACSWSTAATSAPGLGSPPCHICTGLAERRLMQQADVARPEDGGRNRGPTCHSAWAPRGTLCGACQRVCDVSHVCRGGQQGARASSSVGQPDAARMHAVTRGIRS